MDAARSTPEPPPNLPLSEFPSITPEVTATIRVLVVDDDRTLRDGCAQLLRSFGYSVTTTGSGSDALDQVREQRFDVILLDLLMQPVGGAEILTAAVEAHPDTLVIIITGRPSVASSLAALQAGAWDYLPKPFSASHLEILMGRATAAIVSGREPRRGRLQPAEGAAEPSAEPSQEAPLGASPVLRDALRLVRRVARTDASVMLIGESGTGKTFLARRIYNDSRRAAGPLVPVSCSALTEADLLGYGEQPGLLEAARGGTLLLDEPTELAYAVQTKLLRVLREGTLRRLGPVRPPAVVDIRLISETRRDPDDAVRAGKLRRDLAGLLRVVPIRLPPLREQQEAVAPLATYLLSRDWVRYRGRDEPPPTLTDRCLEWLRSLPWPGNIRQLEDTMESVARTAGPGSRVDPEGVTVAGAPPTGGSRDVITPADFDDTYNAAKEKIVTQFEREYLPRLVDRAGGNIARAARLASVNRATLYRLLAKHELPRDQLE